MGKIKKILENELVGGTQTTDVYPVTSTKAVYDENNERLDDILRRNQEKFTELESETRKQLINVIPVQNNQYLIKEGFLIVQTANKWIKQNAKYIIYPLTGSGTIKIERREGVSSVISTLSEYSEPYQDMPGNIVHNVVSNPINYDSTEKYLYILLFYNSDRLPISIFVNGYDIMKDVKENLDSGFNAITTERIPNGSITPEKLSSNFNEVRIGILYYGSPNVLNFDFTNKTCTIPISSRIFLNSGFALITNQDNVLDLTHAYDGTEIPAGGGGVIIFDTTTSKCKIIKHTNSIYNRNFVVIATYNIKTKNVCSPSTYSIDGRMYGLYKAQDIIKKISPDFELIKLPNGVRWWSDFITINIDGTDEMWIFAASSDENHQSNNGAIYRIKMSDWTLIATIKHNFGHCNTVHYDKYHDNLLIANLPGTTQLPSALYIFYNISSWIDNSSLDFNSLSPSIIDVSSVIPSNLAAFWAENGFDNRNQVYIISAYGSPSKFAKIVLGMGTNQLTNGTYDDTHINSGEFNGTFDILIQPITYNNPADNDNNKNVIQGGDFVNGQVITANGHDQIYGFIWSYNPKESLIERVEIDSVPRKANGEIDYSIGEGLCVHNGYIYHGYIKTSTDFRTNYTLQGYYLAKYRIP